MFDRLKSKLNIDDINSHSNDNLAPARRIYPHRKSGDAPYELEEGVLRSVIYIPKSFNYGRDGRVPVILVAGTGAYGGEAFENNFAKLLKASTFADPVWLNVPGRMNGAAHLIAEHVAYAIHYIVAALESESSNYCLVSSLATQWSLKYWPRTRLCVANFIAISADFHGTIEASLTLPLKVGLGNPGVRAQKRHSKFVKALRADDGDSAYVPTTSIYSAIDEILQPQTGTCTSAFMKDNRGVGVYNCELQRVAPYTPAGLIYTHFTVLSNPISWALAADAIVNGGPGQIARINAKELYCKVVAPGLTLGDGAKTEGLLLSTGASVVAYHKKLTEPKLSAYATARSVPPTGGNYTEEGILETARMMPQIGGADTENGVQAIIPQIGKVVAENPQEPATVRILPQPGGTEDYPPAYDQVRVYNGVPAYKCWRWTLLC